MNPKFTEDETIQLIHIRNHPDIQQKFIENKGKHYKVWEEIGETFATHRKAKVLSSKYNKMLKIYQKYYEKEKKNPNIEVKWPYYEHMKKYHGNIYTNINEKNGKIQKDNSKSKIKLRKGCAYKSAEDFSVVKNNTNSGSMSIEESIEDSFKGNREGKVDGNDNFTILKLQMPESERLLKQIANDILETKNYIAKMCGMFEKYGKKFN